MNVFTTATNISQAFKNAGRVKEILGVLVRHGFSDLAHRMKLTRFLPFRYSENPRNKNLPPAVRLRASFEELGPTFVKLGQLLATRSDLIPEAFIDEFQKLQDNVSSVPYSEIEQFLAQEWKAPLHQVFAVFDHEPMAAASIAQVHGAILKSGEKVAVKVQRPNIEKLIQNDISILRGLAILMEHYLPETRVLNPKGLVEEFFKTILFELDFLVEANNVRRIRQNMQVFPKIAIPKVYAELSTSRVLVLERFEGVRFSNRESILAKGIPPNEIVEAGSEAFFHMVMHDGLFHGDLHPGNLFVLDDGRIGMIDFGIVGRLSRRVQDSITIMFTALMDEDYETLANEYLNLCPSTGSTDSNAFQKDLMDLISPYVGMTLGDINVGKILLRTTSTAAKNRLVVPREMMLLFKAMVTIEAMGKKLDPSFDMMKSGTRLAKQILTARYSRERLTHDLIVLGRDLQGLLETVPRLSKRFLRIWSQNNFAIETKNQDVAALARNVDRFNELFPTAILGLCLFALGITFLILDRGPKLLGVSIASMLCISPAIWLLTSPFRKRKIRD